MVLFLAGTPGIGKTTVAHAIAELRRDVTVFSADNLRADMGATTTTNPLVEDAVNWRLFTGTAAVLRRDETDLVIIDTNGISKRLPYLRYALGEHRQKLVRLTAGFPYARCAQKWGQTYTQGKFDHINAKVTALAADHDVGVDGKTPHQVAREILDLL